MRPIAVHPVHASYDAKIRQNAIYGGWGKIIYEKLDIEYERRKKEEKAEGKSGWAAFRGSGTSSSA